MAAQCARNGRLIARTILQRIDVYLCVFVWSVFVENAQETVMMIGSRRGMQHDDVVREEVAEGLNNEMCARVQGRCVFPKVWCKMHGQTYNKEGTGKQTPNTSITKGPVPTQPEREAHKETAEEDAVCGAGTDTETDTETPSRREPVPARPERDTHQETAEEDAVCGAETGKMC